MGDEKHSPLEAVMRDHIDRLRKDSGLSGTHVQEMVAKITGIGRGTINAYCRNKRPVGEKNGPKIADALGLTWDALVQAVEAARLTDSQRRAARVAEIQRVLPELQRELEELTA